MIVGTKPENHETFEINLQNLDTIGPLLYFLTRCRIGNNCVACVKRVAYLSKFDLLANGEFKPPRNSVNMSRVRFKLCDKKIENPSVLLRFDFSYKMIFAMMQVISITLCILGLNF